MARTKKTPAQISSTDSTAKGSESKTKAIKKTDKPSKKRISRSERAGLTFPVGRMHRKLREATHGKLISAGASTYMTAVLEYLSTELIEMSGFVSQNSNKARITPRHLHLAIHGDEEFHEMFKNVTVSEGGVLPKPIHPTLLPKKKSDQDHTENAHSS